MDAVLLPNRECVFGHAPSSEPGGAALGALPLTPGVAWRPGENRENGLSGGGSRWSQRLRAHRLLRSVLTDPRSEIIQTALRWRLLVIWSFIGDWNSSVPSGRFPERPRRRPSGRNETGRASVAGEVDLPFLGRSARWRCGRSFGGAFTCSPQLCSQLSFGVSTYSQTGQDRADFFSVRIPPESLAHLSGTAQLWPSLRNGGEAGSPHGRHRAGSGRVDQILPRGAFPALPTTHVGVQRGFPSGGGSEWGCQRTSRGRRTRPRQLFAPKGIVRAWMTSI